MFFLTNISHTSNKSCIIKCILILALCFSVFCEHLSIDTTITKTVYDFRDGGNHKTSKKLNFANGDWYYLPSFKRLEFQTRTAGMLDFNIQIKPFYKVLYLEGIKRVLVFPQEPVGITQRKPYVDWSKISQEANPIKIFPQSEEDLGNAENLNEAFNGLTNSSENILDLVFGDEKQQLIKEWNHLPFFDPENINSPFDGLSNKWGLFNNLDHDIFGILQKDVPDILNDLRLMGLSPHDIVTRGMLKKINRYIYYDDTELMFTTGMSDQNKIKIKHINISVVYMYPHIRFDLDLNKDDLDKKRLKYMDERLMNPMMQIAYKMGILFINTQKVVFINEFFDVSIETTLENRIRKRKDSRFSSPVGKEMFEFSNSIYQYSLQRIQNAIENGSDQDIDIQYKELGDLINQAKVNFKEIFLLFVETYSSPIVENWSKEKNPDDGTMKYINEESSLYPALLLMKEEGVDNNGKLLQLYSKIDNQKTKQQYLEDFANFDFGRLFDDFMLQYFIGIAMYKLESYIFEKNYFRWDKFDQIDLYKAVNDISAYPLIREFMYMFGDIPMISDLDLGFLKHDSENIFKLENDRLLI